MSESSFPQGRRRTPWRRLDACDDPGRDVRGSGVGSKLLVGFEQAALERGARRIVVTSFTFQAPGFYERHGFREIFRWEGVPIDGQADIHLRKDL